MQRQGRRDTKPEVALRQALHRLGYRFRVAYPVPGIPRRSVDVAFPSLKVAVFVDGCFWHACPEHGVPPRNNAQWWQSKLGKNVQRDRETDLALASKGWAVLRIWEHVPTAAAAAEVVAKLEEKRS